MNQLPPTFLPLDKLFEKWEYAQYRRKVWEDLLTAFPENDNAAHYFAKYDAREKMFYMEIEKRADELPCTTLLPLGIVLNNAPKIRFTK